jgi:AAA15 family ATPase/GTPase
MLEKLSIKNYKSILDTSIELGRINVFIGENGCGKTNILEALAMVSASKDYDLDVEGLYNRGVRVTKPSLTFSSFLGKNRLKNINIELNFNNEVNLYSSFYCDNSDDISSEWKDKSNKLFDNTAVKDEYKNALLEIDAQFNKLMNIITINRDKYSNNPDSYAIYEKSKNNALKIKTDAESGMKEILKKSKKKFNISALELLGAFIIYNLSTKALRGIYTESRKTPLGINGEGLDILIANFDKKELETLNKYSHFISWFDGIINDEEDRLKFEGHKLGKSTSILYFKDKFMQKKNNIFSAENANEGILHVLFYFSLFISKRTPKLFAIDNIEIALNPKLCRNLMKSLAELAKENDKQALITTHNPAILDGMNLHDDEQRLFVVSRSDEGYTKVKRIKIKPEVKGEDLKLSEMWMRGYLGGLPQNF